MIPFRGGGPGSPRYDFFAWAAGDSHDMVYSAQPAGDSRAMILFTPQYDMIFVYAVTGFEFCSRRNRL